MKNCPNCDSPFSKKQVLRSNLFGYYKLKCSSCGAQYEHTFKDRLLVVILPFLSCLAAALISKHFNLSIPLYFIMTGILVLLLVFFIVRGFKYERTN